MAHHYYPSLFPNNQEQEREASFGSNFSQLEAYETNQCMTQYDQSEEQDVIEQQLLKKTSELHEALRNIKLLKFQLIESKIMKKKNMAKCDNQENKIREICQKKSVLEQQNQELNREIELYKQKLRKQKQSNRISYQNLHALQGQVNQLKIEHKCMMEKDQVRNLLNNKQNSSLVANNRFISVEKISLNAQNKSIDQMIGLIKDEITSLKKRFGQAQAKKIQLQNQYKLLLQQLNKDQGKKIKKKTL